MVKKLMADRPACGIFQNEALYPGVIFLSHNLNPPFIAEIKRFLSPDDLEAHILEVEKSKFPYYVKLKKGYGLLVVKWEINDNQLSTTPPKKILGALERLHKWYFYTQQKPKGIK